MFSLLSILITLICHEGNAPMEQPPLSITWELKENHYQGQQQHLNELTLTNNGSQTLAPSGWQLYFNTVRPVLPDSVTGPFEIEHLDGDFFRLSPSKDFAGLEPGKSISLQYVAAYWSIKEVDGPRGFFLIWNEDYLNPSPTLPVTIVPLTRKKQTTRTASDILPVPTPASIYAENERLKPLTNNEIPPVVPTPRKYKRGTGSFELSAITPITYAAGLENEAAYLANTLSSCLKGKPRAQQGEAKGGIHLAIGTFDKAEVYRLEVTEQGVTITGSDAAGVFYGIQSLRSLIPLQAHAQPQSALTLPCWNMEDAPGLRYRGFHLDVARNFQSMEQVLKVLDLMATYKLNRFHFHLTDDEGWRLEIPGLPELVSVGSRRGPTDNETTQIYPAYGSGSEQDNHGSGFYRREQFMEILRYANARHIEVIPEIDMPGHARAAIKAMQARADKLKRQGQERTTDFLLHDPGDESEYQSVQFFDDNVICVCQDSTYTFLAKVVDEVVAMFDEAGVPLKRLHMGGDEVPGGVWEKSPACERLRQMRPELKGEKAMTTYFWQRMGDLLRERNLELAGWEEIALIKENGHHVPNPAFAGKGYVPYVWNNVIGWGAEDLAYQLANAGYPVVLSPVSNLYFDMAYDKHPQEPGFYWGGFVDTRKVFDLAPYDMYRMITIDSQGKAVDGTKILEGKTHLNEKGRANILGIQGQLWGETLFSGTTMEYMAFPKLLALAERAWNPTPDWATTTDVDKMRSANQTDWNRFAHALGQRELPRLDHLHGGTAYRVPAPGAIIKEGKLHANIAFPNLPIYYTTDGTEPTTESNQYKEPVTVKGTVKLKAITQTGNQSRTQTLSTPKN